MVGAVIGEDQQELICKGTDWRKFLSRWAAIGIRRRFAHKHGRAA